MIDREAAALIQRGDTVIDVLGHPWEVMVENIGPRGGWICENRGAMPGVVSRLTREDIRERRPALVHAFDFRGQALCGSSNQDDGDAPASHDPAEITCAACIEIRRPAPARADGSV